MKDPAFLFYSSDFLTGTMLLTDEQVGKYIRLLCLQHQKGRLTKEHMINICKTYDKDIFEKFIEDDAGLFYNSRLEKETIKRKTYCESRRNNRLSPSKSPKKKVKNICKTYVPHMDNENIDENIYDIDIFKETKILLEKEFIKAVLKQPYISYLRMRKSINKPFKSADSVKKNYEHLRKLSDGNVETAISILDQSIANQWQGLFQVKTKN